ncbi:retron-type reverse transcriptase [Pantoea ananatis]|uniref:retron St85 family RNA-directed DNA polymerase n=1 Tax=Pantoea ananas TaxID=553 RepID=UPI000DC29889|nr:retron St85 family RNA-directed DNA polymerase [Pantoea ananatis]RAR65396.1 retron-type reverse transcriptase [Pantoea ananatis]
MQIEKFLCEKHKLTNIQLATIAAKAPKRYRVYYIPKRTTGFRVIAQPTKKIKEIQRTLVTYLKDFLPVHSSATAYQSGISIKDNANRHKGNDYLLKMDFQNFFNKVKPELFFEKLSKLEFNITKKDAALLHDFLFWKPGQKRSKTHILSVGAPSSPFISNFVMYEFDRAMNELCVSMGVVYTRYADDITFSTSSKGVLFVIPRIVKALLAEHASGLTINESKTVFSSKAHNRHITGVTITNEGELSIGRKKKRYLSSLIFRYSLNELTEEEVLNGKGLLSHCIHIEPDFILRMKIKYGHDLVDKFLAEGAR